MRYLVALVFIFSIISAFTVAGPAYAGPREDCEQYQHHQNHELGIRACTVVIRGNRKAPNTYFQRGAAYYAIGDYDRAVADYSEAIRLGHPESYIAYNNRALAYVLKGDYERAITDYTESLKLNPRYALAYSNRGIAHHYKRDYDQAIADISKAIEIDPKYASAYNERGWIRYLKAQYDQAIADATTAIGLDSTKASFLHTRGAAYLAQQRYDRAIADFDKALGLDATHFDSVADRGKAYDASGDHEKALEDYNRLLALPARNNEQREKQAEVAKLVATPKAAPPLASGSPVATSLAPKAVKAPVAPSGPATGATLGRRVALAIGNGAYRSKLVDSLPNPRKDASDIAAALKATGFTDVTVLHDLGLREMQRTLAAFEAKAVGAEWVVVYYGGHAIQVDGKNYLVPVDAELKSPSDVEDETVVLDRVLARIAAAGKLRLVILDACRSNPFRRSWSGVKTRDVAERGLARVEPKEPNVLIAYAAADGEAALDGPPGENSPYVKALVKHLATPGLELGKLFRLVRDEVMAQTDSKQRPFEYGSLSGEDLFFRAASR